MAKAKLAADEQIDKQDFDLFDALTAIDRKDYAYYDRLSPEQQKKFVPFMMLHWISAIKGSKDIQTYYLQSTDYHANKYMFNENVGKHPKLQWLMLCAASPGIGKQFHQWIPQIKDRVSRLRESPKQKDIKEYFKKIYPGKRDDELSEMSEEYVNNHRRRMYLASEFPSLKYDEIELLSVLTTDEDIETYKEACGN